jgi:hypothetical protein
MKLRIKGDSIRLRLSQSEVNRFAESGEVQDTIRFSPTSTLTYRLCMDSEVTALTTTFARDCITIRVPIAIGTTWATTDRVGMEHSAPTGIDDGHLRILIEKDFQCLTVRPGEDESDNYPHPTGVHKVSH